NDRVLAFAHSFLTFFETGPGLLRPLAHAPLLFEERLPFPSPRCKHLLTRTFLGQEFPAGLLEHRRRSTPVRQGVDDGPFLDRGARCTSSAGVRGRTRDGEDASVVDPWGDRGRRRPQRQHPFDTVVPCAPHRDAPFGLRLMVGRT